MLLRSQSISYFIVKRTIWLKGNQNGNHKRAVRTTATRNKHCEKLTSRRLWTCSLWISGPLLFYIEKRNSICCRFESFARSSFRNAYLLQPLFWRLYVVAALVTLKSVSTLNVEIWIF